MSNKTWFHKHQENLSRGDRVADAAAGFIGSWRFVIGQAILLLCWAVFNSLHYFHPLWFDKFPFVFMNLFMSAEAAFSTPLIMMSQNRAAQRDKDQAQHQYIEQEQELKLQTEILLKQNDILDQLLNK